MQGGGQSLVRSMIQQKKKKIDDECSNAMRYYGVWRWTYIKAL